MQVRLYYPDVKKKIAAIFRQDYEIWTEAIQAAKKNGEIRQDLDEKDVALIFRQMFLGLSFEQAFLEGLDSKLLKQKLLFVYKLLKA